MRFESSDVDSVQSTWRQFVPSAQLQSVDPLRFHFDWHSSDLDGVAFVRYDLDAQVRSLAAPDGQLLVCRVDAPHARSWTDSRDLDATRPWITDGRPVRASWDREAQVRALVFDHRAAETTLRRITGDDSLVLRSTSLSPRSAAHARRWELAFARLEEQLAAELTPALRAARGRDALIATVAAFDSTFDEALLRVAQRRAAPSTVRRALAYIDENAHLPITVDDVAAACFISTRGLHYAFRRALDTTPAAALRRARLAGAHAELSRGTTTPIADIARRWGFSHPSRFAAAYRRAYGSAPSDARRVAA
ncbi:helix-turn-helix transcriptional regulator [Microbacterium sp. XT11]|uniref:helix-turn-helix transcriptional regulator n=1 Tax=Microbacterium sp. XT11 TaxID=367477 RepID=UPI00082D23FD|nr:AraC family transcriptional regulator [Microbacterium sp. XT11]